MEILVAKRSESKGIQFEELKIDGLNPDRVLAELNVTNEGQPKPTNKTLRHITEQFKGLKKKERLRLLYDLFPNDTYWSKLK